MTVPLKAAATGAGRTARIDRVTRETSISVEVNLDGSGRAELATGVPFLDHMLDQVARHGMIDLTVSAKGDLHIDGHHTVEDVGITFGQAVKQALGDKAGLTRYGYAYVPLDEALSRVVVDLTVRAQGDLHIDAHHTVEDIGITLGQAFRSAVGDKKGIVRYGYAYVPLDEALSRVVIDVSGRPGLEFHVPFTRAMIGTFDVDLTHEFFQGFVNHALVTLHVDNLRGDNAHHQAETVFKAFARAVRMAVSRDPRAGSVIPSTKGAL